VSVRVLTRVAQNARRDLQSYSGAGRYILPDISTPNLRPCQLSVTAHYGLLVRYKLYIMHVHIQVALNLSSVRLLYSLLGSFARVINRSLSTTRHI